jgi:CheY-like chemotaxis protein
MSHPSVLVVDDDEGIRETLQEVLTAEGFDVTVAENGAVALEAMRSTLPDVVLLDLMMPVMSGWELLETVGGDESLRGTPIIVLSAMSAPLASKGAFGGVRCCFSKPVDLGALLSALETVTAGAYARTSDRAHAHDASRAPH